MDKPTRLGIFGGTFDPVHRGHIALAEELVTVLSLDAMYLMPCQLHPHLKQPCATPEQRLAMLDLAVADNNRLGIDDRELRRSGLSYMVDSLTDIRLEQGDSAIICCVLGSDAFADFHHWHRWQVILELANLVVMNRAGQPLCQPCAEPLLQALIDQSISELNSPAGEVMVVELSPYNISSTAIRNQLSRANSKSGAETSGLKASDLPRGVLDFIQKHQLY